MMSLLPEKHIAVLPFIGASHFQPLVNLVLKLAAAAPRVLFSLLIATGDKHLLSCSDLPVNVKLYEAISSPWLSPPPGESRKEKMQQFLEGAPRTYEMAIAVAEETAGVKKFRHDEEARSQPERTLEGIPGLSRMRIKDLPEALQHTYLDDMYTLFRVFRELGTVLPRADAVLVISYDEVTPEPLVANLKSKFQELLLVGSLTASFTPPLHDSGSNKTGCLAWLDKQKHQSVAYISFGTVVGLPPEELFILAEALEASRTPYLWSLKDHLYGPECGLSSGPACALLDHAAWECPPSHGDA
ncbi:UDP-glycosyltransferase 78D4-like isoform X4 [Punica granatum]|uniref:UDP-glycosyltransferase 78D4-like isoform X4 n=1 Tax=Punica granatum TaxID=22663 RepID=A0A6P8CEY5_PUNGR|nr:UDP-glycosyltransferase 78D4-like isoform X4 [Punica granatum]